VDAGIYTTSLCTALHYTALHHGMAGHGIGVGQRTAQYMHHHQSHPGYLISSKASFHQRRDHVQRSISSVG
jgi:hypothetical protein